MSDVGNNIRKIRIERGLSQYKLAQLSGVAQPTINSIERENQTRSPAVDTVQKIAAALECPVSVLLGEYQGDDSQIVKDERKLLSAYRSLNQSGKNQLLQYVEFLISRPDLKKENVKAI